jgi:DNA-binding response OmpR family regulator
MRTQKSILVIEDDHDIRVSYREALEFQKFTIHSATNGFDGLFLLEKLKKLPDLIILDLGMPLMGGEEFLKKKNLIENIKDIPVIVISNMPFISENIPYLRKPVELDEFLAKVDECLGITLV